MYTKAEWDVHKHPEAFMCICGGMYHMFYVHCMYLGALYLFLNSGVCFIGLELSVFDIMVSQKSSNEDEKLQFFGQDYRFIVCTLKCCIA